MCVQCSGWREGQLIAEQLSQYPVVLYRCGSGLQCVYSVPGPGGGRDS